MIMYTYFKPSRMILRVFLSDKRAALAPLISIWKFSIPIYWHSLIILMGCSLFDNSVTMKVIPACFLSSLISPTPGLCQSVTCDWPMRAQPSLDISSTMFLAGFCSFFLGCYSSSSYPFFSSYCLREISASLVFARICFYSFSAFFLSYSAFFYALVSSNSGCTTLSSFFSSS